MDILKTILMIIFAIDCIALSAIVLMQEGKTQGLGSIGGMSTDTYWGQNKNPSEYGLHHLQGHRRRIGYS